MLSDLVVWLAVGSVGYDTLDGAASVVGVGMVEIFWARAKLTRFRLMRFC